MFTISRVKENQIPIDHLLSVLLVILASGIVVRTNKKTVVQNTWKEESAVGEAWRMDIPDECSAEFRHRIPEISSTFYALQKK